MMSEDMLIVSQHLMEKAISEATIKWHPTTPKYFRCAPGCFCCCAINFFLPSEMKQLPSDITRNIGIYCAKCRKTNVLDATFCSNCGVPLKIGMNCVYRAKPFNEDFGCIFFRPKQKLHCSIHQHRPLRCKLYPYMPFLSGEDAQELEIVILAEPLTEVFRKEETPEKEWMRCYGLGQGKNVEEEIKRLSREFLLKLCQEMPSFLMTVWRTEPIDSLIIKNYLRKHTNPKYKTWKEANRLGIRDV